MSDKVSNGGAQVFQTVNREARLSDKVTEAILETIASNQLKPGDPCRRSASSGEQFGVSRTVIREAVRALRAKGMLEVKSGSGVRIVAVDEGTVRESMRHFVKGSQLDYSKVDEVRRMLEVAAAGIAAERATADDIERDRRDHRRHARTRATTSRRASSRPRLPPRDRDRHPQRAVPGPARLDGRDAASRCAGGTSRAAPRERRLVVEMHRHIRDGIAAHEPRTARQAMRDHLGHVVATWADHESDQEP